MDSSPHFLRELLELMGGQESQSLPPAGPPAVARLYLLSELEALTASPNDPLPARRAYLRAKGVRHGAVLWVGRNFWVTGPGRLVLGERCALGNNTTIETHSLVQIGDDFLGSSGLTIGSGTHDPETLLPRGVPVRIGRRVWVGHNVSVLAGVSIGDDVVIGAGSVVVRDIPSNCVAVGVPARVVRPLQRKPGQRLWTWVRSSRVRQAPEGGTDDNTG